LFSNEIVKFGCLNYLENTKVLSPNKHRENNDIDYFDFFENSISKGSAISDSSALASTCGKILSRRGWDFTALNLRQTQRLQDLGTTKKPGIISAPAES
jgi:hypothetical protein